jgi:hypothetical protein
MKVVVSGSTGLVGSALIPSLTCNGHTVVRLVRHGAAPGGDAVRWDPAAGTIDSDGLESADVVVHLAGEGIAHRRWSVEQKARIRDSRVQGTRLLCESIAQLAHPPHTLVCASAIGYYGSRGDDWLNEDSAPGSDFLAEVCRDWEAATSSALQAETRVVRLRLGVVLSAAGGALQRMLTPFRMGVGGKLGSGQQYMSWVAIDDVIGAIQHVLALESLHGPFNVVSPHPVTNYEFTKTLGRVLGRPTVFPMPAFVARLAFGEMADALLLSSTRVTPARLLDSGYQFRCPDIEAALRHVLYG